MNLKMISMKSDAEIMLNSFKQQLVRDFIILLLKLMKKHHLVSACRLVTGNELKHNLSEALISQRLTQLNC